MSQFTRKMIEILNHGAFNLALALGYRNRIFDRMDDLDRPATLAEIADATGLRERYLREWMGIMLKGQELSVWTENVRISFVAAKFRNPHAAEYSDIAKPRARSVNREDGF